MKQLEKKILRKVYLFETQNTLARLILRVLAILVFATGGVILVMAVVKQLVEQQTLDVLEIVFEDFDIVKAYIGEVVETLLQEIPKTHVLFALGAISIALILLLTIIKNFAKLRNKINSLSKYWLAH